MSWMLGEWMKTGGMKLADQESFYSLADSAGIANRQRDKAILDCAILSADAAKTKVSRDQGVDARRSGL